VACALTAATVNRPAELAHSVAIYRDTYGVPHIYGPTRSHYKGVGRRLVTAL
jgi:acyl-homoserine lactone acylase PvdQ